MRRRYYLKFNFPRPRALQWPRRRSGRLVARGLEHGTVRRSVALVLLPVLVRLGVRRRRRRRGRRARWACWLRCAAVTEEVRLVDGGRDCPAASRWGARREGGSYQTGCPLGGAVAARWRRAAADCRCRGLCEPWGRMRCRYGLRRLRMAVVSEAADRFANAETGFCPDAEGVLALEEADHKRLHAPGVGDRPSDFTWAARSVCLQPYWQSTLLRNAKQTQRTSEGHRDNLCLHRSASSDS